MAWVGATFPFVAQHSAGAPLTRFQGIRASNSPMPQVSVTPANTSPAPTNAASPAHAGCTSQPRATPRRTSDPAAIRTCRSRDIAFWPRTTGRPASAHACVPPSTFTTFVSPPAVSFSQAFWPRLPDRQMT
jgi:hypothetical protein